MSRAWLAAFALTLGLAASLCALTVVLFPSADSSRDVALARVIAQGSPTPAAERRETALDLCTGWTGEPAAQVDCLTARRLRDGTPVRAAQAGAAWQQAMGHAAQRLQSLQSLAAQLDAHQARRTDPTLAQPQQHLLSRLDAWQDRVQRLRSVEPTQATEQEYRRLFSLVLELDGEVYQGVAARFDKVNWHVTRAIDVASPLPARAEALAASRAASPWAVGGVALTLMLLGWWRGGWAGWWLGASVSCIAWLGLLVTADAAVRFGDGSAIFTLNPLGNQLTRQLLVWLAMGAVIVTVALMGPVMRSAMSLASGHLGPTLGLLLLATGAGYALLGPATGSETLKVSVALAAGLVTAGWGRIAHLAAQLAPAAMAPRHILTAWRDPAAHAQTTSAGAVIAHALGRPVWLFASFCGSSVGLAALVFHDLGAALVTSVVSVSALFFVFGARIAAVVVAVMATSAVALSQTDKVQERIALMLDPLGASISDFARLVAFAQAAHDRGFPLGEMAWCNGSGACLPLQALSDYMPTVLAGLFGFRASLAFFVLFLLLLLAAGWWLVRQYLTRQGADRALAMGALYLVLATAAQTLITFLGNWRVIPLTGMGTPLLSIGLSSTLAPALACGLILSLMGSDRSRRSA